MSSCPLNAIYFSLGSKQEIYFTATYNVAVAADELCICNKLL